MVVGDTASLSKRAADHTHRVAELKLKAKKAIVMSAMEKHPIVVKNVLEHLQELGYLKCVDDSYEVVAFDSGVVASPSKTTLGVQKRLRTLEAKEQAVEDVYDSEGELVGTADLVPSTYGDLQSLGVTLLHKPLAQLEPGMMSYQNTKLLLHKGDRLRNQKLLSGLVELGTGVPQDYRLCGQERRWKVLPHNFTLKYTCRGRRLRDVTAPIDLEGKDGLYEISFADDTFFVTHRFLKQKVGPNHDRFPHFNAVSALSIKYGWSETRTVVVSFDDRDHNTCVLSQFFHLQTMNVCVVSGVESVVVVKTPPKRTMPMLIDAGVAQGDISGEVVSQPAKRPFKWTFGTPVVSPIAPVFLSWGIKTTVIWK